MIVRKFPGDENVLLMKLQEERFPSIGSWLFREAAARYIKSARLLGLTDEFLYQEVKKVYYGRCEFGILTRPYEHLAAYFRLTVDNGGQLPLPYNGYTDYEQYLAFSWCNYYSQQAQKLAEEDSVVHWVVRMIILPPSKPAMAALEEFMDWLNENYSLSSRKDFEQNNRPTESWH